MNRHEFSAKTKVSAFERAKGACELCCTGIKLRPGDIFYDHVIADALGGEATLENCQVLCRSHHDAKTRKDDVPAIAKAKRRQRNHAGIRKPSRFPASRDSKWKKKLDGSVVLRTN